MFTNRRKFLLGGGVLVGLPWLRHLAPRAHAQSADPTLTADGYPKRLLIVFKPNGVYPQNWFPSGDDGATNYQLNTHTEPLAPFRDRITFLDGIDNRLTTEQNNLPGDNHNKGTGSLLTGWQLTEGNLSVGGNSRPGDYPIGPSIDQLIARQVGRDSAIQSLQVGALCQGGRALSRPINFAGNKRALMPQHDPAAVFRQVFEGRDVPEGEREAVKAKRLSVLDFVQEEFSQVLSQASLEDRPRLEEHAGFVRDLELRLAGETATECEFPVAPRGGINPSNQGQMDQIYSLQRDMVAHAFACDLTRVATLMAGTGANQLQFTFFDNHGNDHVLAHGERRNRDNARNHRAPRHLWYMEQFRDTLAKLDSFPEGNGTVLDHTLVLFCSENTTGGHSHERHPFILGGGLGGHFKRGQLLKFNRASHSDLLVSILEAFGVDHSEFGNREFVNGPMDKLRA